MFPELLPLAPVFWATLVHPWLGVAIGVFIILGLIGALEVEARQLQTNPRRYTSAQKDR